MMIIYGVLLMLNSHVLLCIRQSIISSMFIRGTFPREVVKMSKSPGLFVYPHVRLRTRESLNGFS
jgi:hypothetical protein